MNVRLSLPRDGSGVKNTNIWEQMATLTFWRDMSLLKKNLLLATTKKAEIFRKNLEKQGPNQL